MCEGCEPDTYPRIHGRGGRWSPLQLGLMSLICDVFLIPTVLAISRGIGDLREVARREREGYWDAEHPSVRTGAVWGALLGAARPLLVVFLVLVVSVGVALEPPSHEHTVASSANELEEIIDRLDSDDLHTRQLAIRHIGELPLDAARAERIYDRLEAPPALPPADDREVRGALIRAVLGALHVEVDPDARLEQLASHADSIDAPAVEALADAAAARGTARSYAVLVELMGRPEAPPLPIEALLDHASGAHMFLAPLLELDLGSPGRRDAVHLASRVCGVVSDAELRRLETDSTTERALMVDWARARGALLALPEPTSLAERLDPERTRAVAYATDALFGLRCASSPAVDPVLRSASRASSRRVRAAALITRSRSDRADRPSIGRLARLLEDPFTRRWALDAWPPDAADPPERHRSTEALAEADLIAWLVEHELTPDAIEHEALQRRTITDYREALTDVHLFAVRTGDRVERFGLGPYANERAVASTWREPGVVPAGPALDADWGGVSAARLVDRVLTQTEMSP